MPGERAAAAPNPARTAADRKKAQAHLSAIQQAHQRCLKLQLDALTHGRRRNDIINEAARLTPWSNKEVAYLLQLRRLEGDFDFLGRKKERDANGLPANATGDERLALVIEQHSRYVEALTKIVAENNERRKAEKETEKAVQDRAEAINNAKADGIPPEEIANVLTVSVLRVDQMSKQDRQNRYESET